MTRRPRNRRQAELAKIHLGKKQLGLDDATYRAMLREIAGVDSAADLTALGRAKVLDHLRAKGAQFHGRGRGRPGLPRLPQLRKIYALLGERPISYAEGILKQMYGQAAPARLEWASPDQLHKLIAALNYDAKRRSNTDK